MNTNLGLVSHASAAGGGAGGNSGEEMELELGLGLGLGLSLSSGGGYGTTTNANITTKETISSITRNVSGTKRAAADSLTPSHAATPSNSASQVVGWPPIKTYRMNNLVNYAKTGKNGGEEKGVGRNDDGEGKSESKKKNDITNNNNDSGMKETGHSGFVKVNMDGLPIGRKVDLNAHTCYETLAQLLEEMFYKPSTSIGTICGQKQQPEKQSKLLDGSSEFVLTYEDKEGDFMLVGDVPWRMFLSTVKRLRIMKTSEANGLAPRFQDKQNTKPI